MFSKLLCSLILFPCISLFSQTVRHPVSSPYTSLGAYSSSQSDIFSFSGNQASLAELKNSSAGIHSERRFLLSELNNYAVVAGLHMKTGSFGVRFGYSGFSDYNETQAGITYARKLSGNLDAGVQFNYYAIKIAGYGNSSTLNFAIGYLLHITDKIHFGMQAYNPFGGKFGNNDQEKLASNYCLGFGFESSSKFLVSAEIEKEEDLPLNVKVGFQYKFLTQMMVRAGIVSETSNAYLGIGFIIKSLRIDIIASYHPLLGITPAMLLLFNFKSIEH